MTEANAEFTEGRARFMYKQAAEIAALMRRHVPLWQLWRRQAEEERIRVELARRIVGAGSYVGQLACMLDRDPRLAAWFHLRGPGETVPLNSETTDSAEAVVGAGAILATRFGQRISLFPHTESRMYVEPGVHPDWAVQEWRDVAARAIQDAGND